jgi:hypothetical protein
VSACLTLCPHWGENREEREIIKNQLKNECGYYKEKPHAKGRCIFYRTKDTGVEGHCDQFKCVNTTKNGQKPKWPT